jgi:hypothetical protein
MFFDVPFIDLDGRNRFVYRTTSTAEQEKTRIVLWNLTTCGDRQRTVTQIEKFMTCRTSKYIKL